MELHPGSGEIELSRGDVDDKTVNRIEEHLPDCANGPPRLCAR
jgi:hypothetical protein